MTRHAIKPIPSFEYLSECFIVRKNGVLYWKKRPIHHFENYTKSAAFNNKHAGKCAGYLSTHHTTRGDVVTRLISINGELYRANRLKYVLELGCDPVADLLHKHVTKQGIKGVDKLPELEYLQECFEIHKGNLYWKDRPSTHFKSEGIGHVFNGRYSGTTAGTVTGIVRISRVGHKVQDIIDKLNGEL
jgi:hypothetical protein